MTSALLTTERAGVITYTLLPVNDTVLRATIPITDEFAPTAFIKAMFITKPDKEHPFPRYRITNAKEIRIEPVQRRLNVSITPSTAQAKPGESVRFDLRVTDVAGKPVRAELGLALVDKAVLALYPANGEPMENTFYKRQTHWVYTDLSLDGLLEQFDANNTGPDGHGGGGGPGDPQATLREKFETTPLWLPHLVTDDNGQASASIKLPDNLTTWRLQAQAITMDLKVGQADTEIMSSLPLIVRPVTPRFFVVGDSVQLAAIVNNNTERDQVVTARLDASGVTLRTDVEQTLTIQAGGRARITWPVYVNDATGADLRFSATSKEGLQDASKPTLTTGENGTIPIYRYRTRDLSLSTSGVLRASSGRTEAITLPARYKSADGDLIIRIDPSLGATITDSFTWLRQYPYYCIEQTVSTFLPNLTTLHALKVLGQADPTLEENLKAPLAVALTKLMKEQKPDGSWGWYVGMRSDPLTSAYATLGLIEVRSAGFTVDSAMIDKATRYVITQIVPPIGLENWHLSRQAFYQYVLARAAGSNKADLDALFNVRSCLSIASRAYLLLAYTEQFPKTPEIATLTSDLLTSAILTGTGAHWQ